jgi:hypothetical protein
VTSFAALDEALTRYVESHHVRVSVREMDLERPAEFDGPTITLNSHHDTEARCYFLAHSFGSIVAWSVAFEQTRQMFGELRAAKAERPRDRDRLERAIKAFRDFEERASEYAVWILGRIGHCAAVPAYTEFFRADADAMTIFHRKGTAPAWPEFLAEWKARAARGEIVVVRYAPRPVPPFTPVRIPTQEVVQEVDGE